MDVGGDDESIIWWELKWKYIKPIISTVSRFNKDIICAQTLGRYM